MAIAYDNYANAVSLTVAHTIAAAGNNRILVAFFHGVDSTSAGSLMTNCTYNSVGYTGTFSLTVERYGTYYSTTCFYWLESDLPASSGAYNCVATPGTGMNSYSGHTASFTGVNQIAPAWNSAKDEAPTGNDSIVAITTPADNSVICDSSEMRSGAPGQTLSPTSGQTKLGQTTSANKMEIAVGWEAIISAGSNDQSWESDEYITNHWGATAFAFGPTVEKNYNMLGHNF